MRDQVPDLERFMELDETLPDAAGIEKHAELISLYKDYCYGLDATIDGEACSFSCLNKYKEIISKSFDQHFSQEAKATNARLRKQQTWKNAI
jgi:hypothetical protein